MNPWAIALFAIGFVILLWDARRRRKRDQGGEEGDWGDNGNGGWTDKPSGTPPGGGGPDRDIDKRFHEVCDAVGKTIKFEKKREEKVLL